jgi:MoaA/NifB/PqqE/SkfB family radical SAM enzyme
MLDESEYNTKIAAPPKLIDLKLSNVCNFKCRMCDATTSNLILKEDKKFKNKHFEDELFYLSSKILNTENEKYFIESIVPNLLRIDFTGGEPFFNPEAKKIIQIISKTEYAKNISIIITTNGSIIDKNVLKNLKKFKEVIITVSVDDIGNRLEYQRNGADWENIKSNIIFLKTQKWMYVTLHPTINNYNIWYVDELLDWASENKIQVIINMLHGPENLCIRHLPKNIKDKITFKFHKDKRLSQVLSYMNNGNKENYIMEFLKHTNYLDLIRNEFFEDVFPEWSEIIYDNL